MLRPASPLLVTFFEMSLVFIVANHSSDRLASWWVLCKNHQLAGLSGSTLLSRDYAIRGIGGRRIRRVTGGKINDRARGRKRCIYTTSPRQM